MFKRVEDIFDCAWRILPGVSHALDLGINRLLIEIDQIKHEVVSVPRLNVPRGERPRREVLGVLSDDQLGIGLDRRSENMPVVEDLLGPLRLDETSLRYSDEQVAQAVGVQDIGVVDDDERHVSTDPSPG